MFEIHESESIPSIEVRRAQAVRFLQDAVIAMGSTAAVVVLLGEMLERSETPEQTNTQTFCIDCGDDFVITAGEAEWHAAKLCPCPVVADVVANSANEKRGTPDDYPNETVVD